MRILLFDIDGTLLTCGGAGRHALAQTLADDFAVEDVMPRIDLGGRTDRGIVSDIFAMAEIPDTPDVRSRLRAGYLRRLPAALHARRAAMLPGALDLLSNLRPRDDVRLGILTGNMRDAARAKLAHFDIHHHFAFGGYGDDHHDRDDVARLALCDAERHLATSIDPRAVYVIGDTPLDVRCARAIGAVAVAVTTGHHTRDQLAASRPDHLLDDLRQAASLLAGRVN